MVITDTVLVIELAPGITKEFRPDMDWGDSFECHEPLPGGEEVGFFVSKSDLLQHPDGKFYTHVTHLRVDGGY